MPDVSWILHGKGENRPLQVVFWPLHKHYSMPTPHTCIHTYIQKCRKFKLQYWPSTGKERDNYCEKWFGIVINFNIHLTYVLEISILDIYTMKMKCYIQTKACMQVFIAALFITTQVYIQSKYSLRNVWMNELFIYP